VRTERAKALERTGESRPGLSGVNWPQIASRILTIVASPKAVREVLKVAARAGGTATANDALRATESWWRRSFSS
jgi:hypothetical protein